MKLPLRCHSITTEIAAMGRFWALWAESEHLELETSPCLHQRIDGDRAREQGSNLPDVQLAVKANPQRTAGLPSDHCRTAKRSAVQDHRRPGRNICRAIQLRAARRQVQEMDSVTLPVRLQKCRHCHGNAWISTAVFARSRALRGRSGGCHLLSQMPKVRQKGASGE